MTLPGVAPTRLAPLLAARPMVLFFFNLNDFIGIFVCFVPDFRVQYLDSSRDKNSGTEVPATRGL
jgi:hypothetical protein